MEADSEKPEMPKSQLAVEQPTEGLRIPVVKACEDSEEESPSERSFAFQGSYTLPCNSLQSRQPDEQKI
jgi:hypothetical protein